LGTIQHILKKSLKIPQGQYPIDWLYAACLEYFIFFSIDSSEVRKQYDEYCLSIMQTITYAHDRTGYVYIVQCTVNSKIIFFYKTQL
jgi:hypothetical protein